jgi:hypothetical protein
MIHFIQILTLFFLFMTLLKKLYIHLKNNNRKGKPKVVNHYLIFRDGSITFEFGQ